MGAIALFEFRAIFLGKAIAIHPQLLGTYRLENQIVAKI